VLCDTGRQLLRGMERADSVVIDPHKGLFVPFGTGVVLVRDGKHLQRAYALQGADADEVGYLQDTVGESREVPSPSDLSPELTRPFRGLRLWLALRLAGVGAFRAALEEKLLLARYFHQQLAANTNFEVGAPPDLTVVTFRLRAPGRDADAANEALVSAIQRDGRIYLSSTRLDGRFTLRLAILNARTHRQHVDRAVEVITELGREVRSKQ
jgi:glutamate/tyrosine decarboxylase-like PLP-dependent enzyme